MKSRILVALAAVATLSLFPVACSRKADQPSAPQKVSLRLAWVYDMAEVGIFAAKDKGFYAKENIDLEIRPGGFGLDPLKLVAAGSDTFGVGGAVNLLLAREKGVPVVAIAAEFQNTPVGFIVHKNSGISSFPDFKGRKVGVQTGADTDTLYRALLAKFGMTTKEVREVPIQFDPTPFVSGQIDVLPGYVTNQPITLKNQGIQTEVITASSQGMSVYGNVYFVSEKTLKDSPDLIRRFLRATQSGWQLALRDPDVATSAMRARSKDFTEADLKAIHEAVIRFIRPDEAGVQPLGMTRTRWEATYDVLKKAGLSTAPQPVDQAFTQTDNAHQ